MGIKRYIQSYKDYKSEGEFIDYAYMQYGTYALTVEVSRFTKPSRKQLPEVVHNTIRGVLAYLASLDEVLKRNRLPRERLSRRAH